MIHRTQINGDEKAEKHLPRLSRDEEGRKTIFTNVAKFEEKGIAVTVDKEVENYEAHTMKPTMSAHEENRPQSCA